MLPDQLVQEVKALRAEGHDIDLVDAEGWANIVHHGYGVPPGYSKEKTELLLRFPLSYPNGKPDMFWTDDDLTLAGGGIPKSADGFETTLGKRWRRFSWHPQNWNPASDNLRTYLEFVATRLGKAE
jgi:hypothetical protein